MAKNISASVKETIVLVTGAGGQLGMTFHKHQDTYTELRFVFMDSNTLDITDFEEVKRVFKEIKPDYCVNCAAYTNVEKAEEEPEKAFLINAESVLGLAQICLEHQSILIHISTDYVFDGGKMTPYTVNDTPLPINVYGASKLKGELHIQNIMERYFIIRTSWLYSKEFGKNFYRTILALASKQNELHVTDKQIGCPTDAEHLVTFIVELIRARTKTYGIFHFSDNTPMSWYDFAKQILKENGFENTRIVKDNNYRTKAKRPAYSVLR